LIPVFREYLTLTDQLPLDGIGTIRVRYVPAQLDVANRIIAPPHQEFYFDQTSSPKVQDFLNWLSSRDNLPVTVVQQQYSTVLGHLTSHQKEHDELMWKGIGSWKRNADNSFHFSSTNESYTPLVAVKAEKVIRENVAHAVQVGESSVDSITMAKNLQRQKGKFILKSGWGLLLFIAVLALFVWILLTGQLTPSMLSNPTKVVPTEATPTYRVW
jgi:hypothetical protein